MSPSRRADDDSLPQTAAVGSDVVGRRAPTWAISAPARALNRLDLPLPVAPASATTVRPPAIEVRAAVLAMAASARSTPPAGRHPVSGSRSRPHGFRAHRISCGLVAPPAHRAASTAAEAAAIRPACPALARTAEAAQCRRARAPAY